MLLEEPAGHGPMNTEEGQDKKVTATDFGTAQCHPPSSNYGTSESSKP